MQVYAYAREPVRGIGAPKPRDGGKKEVVVGLSGGNNEFRPFQKEA